MMQLKTEKVYSVMCINQVQVCEWLINKDVSVLNCLFLLILTSVLLYYICKTGIRRIVAEGDKQKWQNVFGKYLHE